ncbi:hypothetical protein GCM10010271_27040 [Streptomyces kurssanovii]|nr:hypothetical protein GCM10010271_27040 [Streptomyces kurssanovii]
MEHHAASPAAADQLVVGANPGLVLYDGDRLTAYASVWQVDWSPYGAGNVLVLWHRDRVHLYGSDPRPALWLERDFVRHFPEAEGLLWPEPVVHRVRVRVDLAHGLRADAADVRIAMGDVLGRRAFATDAFPLGGGSSTASVSCSVRAGTALSESADAPLAVCRVSEVPRRGPRRRPTSPSRRSGNARCAPLRWRRAESRTGPARAEPGGRADTGDGDPGPVIRCRKAGDRSRPGGRAGRHGASGPVARPTQGRAHPPWAGAPLRGP